MRGRVMALWALAWLGSTPIGGPIVGWVGRRLAPAGRWSSAACPPWSAGSWRCPPSPGLTAGLRRPEMLLRPEMLRRADIMSPVRLAPATSGLSRFDNLAQGGLSGQDVGSTSEPR